MTLFPIGWIEYCSSTKDCPGRYNPSSASEGDVFCDSVAMAACFRFSMLRSDVPKPGSSQLIAG